MLISEIVKKYSITISSDGENLKCPANTERSDLEFVREHKPDIMKYLRDLEDEKKRAKEEYERKIAAIEGLQELTDITSAWARYNAAMTKFIEEDAVGVPPVAPSVKIEDVAAKYPRAVAFRKACAYAEAAHFKKSEIGKRAKDRILNGEDVDTVIADMEKEWTEYAVTTID